MDYAWIETDHLWDAKIGEMKNFYKWVGDNKLARVSPPYQYFFDNDFTEDVNKTKRFNLGDLDLGIIETDGSNWIVTKSNHLTLYKIYHRLIKSFEIIEACIVIILSYWGLAEYHIGELPTWKNIKVFKRAD